MPIEDLSEPSSPLQGSDVPIVDIVAVHGLYENSSETWTDAETNTLWLRDLYPYRHHKARVLLYSYKAGALASPGDGTADRILPFAISLVAELVADRQHANASKRPIIFLCHGLGGLLVKRALASSSTRRSKRVEHLRSIYISTHAIIFMGTPHKGINKESLLFPRTDDGPGPSQFVISLLKDSEMVNEITDLFAPLMKQFSIYNFWEQMETRHGDSMAYIVDEESAAPAWDNVERCGIMTTHSAMVKMRSTVDHGYRVLLAALERYTRAAPDLIRFRWQNDQKLLEIERREEAEALLQPSLQDLASDNSSSASLNEWFLVDRNPTSYFTGREKHAKYVKKKFAGPQKEKARMNHKIFVIYGLGGSGKTQFCLKYARDNYPSYWGVFWIDASSADNAESSFAFIGQQVGKGASSTTAMNWLLRCQKPWLLILDNADDPDMDVSRYFPPGNHGHIMVTTRNPSVIEHATVGHVRFRGMDPEEAISLLLRSASTMDQTESPNPHTRSLAEGIASELGYLALALAQAGATIRRRIYTLERYLHYYLGHRKDMMSYPRINSAEDANIITTWEIPFQRIAKRSSIEHRDAVDLMHIFAFMHFESIPDEIFLRSWSEFGELKLDIESFPGILKPTSNEEAQVRLRRAMQVLCDYSIVDYEPEKQSCSLHPVVHAWARDRLDESEQRRWSSCTISVLSHCISTNLEASGRQFRRRLIPHMDSCLRVLKFQRPSFPESVETATEIERFAWVYAENGLWKTARMLQTKVIDFRGKHLGQWHEATISAKRSLGYTHWNLFEIEPAIRIQLQVLKSLWWVRPSVGYWARWRFWQPDHVSYCVALSDLTMTLWLAGKRDWSKYVGERAVKGLLQRLGPEDPITLTAMFNLARTYLHVGDHERSHELLVFVLKKRKRLFGSDHPDTLMARNELGILLCARKQHLAVAERLVANVLESRKTILGDEHAYTLWSVNDLSKIVCTRGRPAEAAKLLEDIVPVVQRTLGAHHVGMAMTQSNLARAYAMCERWADAEALLGPLLTTIPPEHPDWIHNRYGYVRIQVRLNNAEAVERECNTLLDKIEASKLLALDDPRTVAIAEELFKLYEAQNRLRDVAALKKRVPALRKDHLVGDPFDVYAVRQSAQGLVVKEAVPSAPLGENAVARLVRRYTGFGASDLDD